MAERIQRRASRWPYVAIAAFVLAVAGGLIARAQKLPEGPEPIAWDREACAHCHMHVGDAHFAAQLQTEDGEVMNFDDPGCLFLYVHSRRPRVHAIYFHDAHQDRWLARDTAGFVPADRTPMGYGLAAVPRATAGAIDAASAERQIAAREVTEVSP